MGKVAGKKPRDNVKLGIALAGSILLTILFIVILAVLLGGLAGG
jgi:hypothetical protein